MENNENKAIKAFRDALENNKELDDMTRISKAFVAMDYEILISFPIWMRVRSMLGMISRIEDKSHLDFKKINDIIHQNISEYDYNILPEINSLEELEELLVNIETSQFMNTPYRKCKCKKCKEDFTLTFGEIEYFEQRKLNTPRTCYYCRKGLEKPKPIEKVEKVKKVDVEKEETPAPTAMEIALKKAGLI